MHTRRFSVAVAAIAAAAFMLAAVAAAKQTSVTVAVPSAIPRANVPWPLTVHVALRGKPYPAGRYRPTLYLVDRTGSPVATFHGAPIGRGVFRVWVVFSRAGSWRYVIPDPVTGDWSFVAPRVRG
jgi:hypothetical protein